MLNDEKIIDLVNSGEMISPFDMEQLQPHSYDARLAGSFRLPHYNEETGDQKWLEQTIEEKDVTFIKSKEFWLGSTIEYLKLPENVVGFVCGKSTIGRNGLQIENAGLIDAGFEGAITLELYNMAPWPVTLTAGMRICQIYFFDVDSPIYKSYRKIGHYNGQVGATLPKYNL